MNVAISAPFIAVPPLLQLFQSKKMDVQGTWLRSDLCHSLASLRINLRVSKSKDERSKIKDQGSMIDDQGSTILAGLRGDTRKKMKKGLSTYTRMFCFTVPGYE